MGAFKKIDKQDVYLTSYLAHKEYEVETSDFLTLNIKYGILPEFTGSTYFPDQTDLDQGNYLPLLYRSLDHLYYRSFSRESNFIEQNAYEHYLATSLISEGVRHLDGDVVYISIPKDGYGINIKPGSFKATLDIDSIDSQTFYVDENYIADWYFLDLINGQFFCVGDIIDSTEGTLLFKHPGGQIIKVGDIIYSHGLAIVTYKPLVDYLKTTQIRKLFWKSTVEVVTYNIHAKVKDFEYNSTLNPSALDGGGNLKSNVSVEAFTPYVTTVGLYNDSHELLAVAKLPYALPKSAETETSIIVNLDVQSNKGEFDIIYEPVTVVVPEEPPANAVSCGTPTQFQGGVTYPTIQPVILGTETGSVTINYNAITVPDRFIVEWNGSVVIDTGYRGGSSFSFGGNNRASFTGSLAGRVDPITLTEYPDFENFPEDGYPLVLGPGQGTDSFVKNLPNPITAVVKVYAPTSGTAWNFITTCPI